MIQEALFSIVNGLGTLTGGFFPNSLPEGVKAPFGRYTQVGGDPLRWHTGTANFETDDFQIDVWAETFDSMKSIRKGIKDALDGYTGSPAGTNVTIHFIGVQNMLDAPNTGLDLYGGTIDITVQYSNT